MITQNEDKSIDVDYDIFSFAGRTALIGGGIYAINQSVKEGKFNRVQGNTFKRRENKVVQALKDTISKNSDAPSRAEKADVSFTQPRYFQNLDKTKSLNRYVGLDKIEEGLTGGYKNRSARLFDSISRLHEKLTYAKNGVAPTMITRYAKDNKTIEFIGFETPSGMARIHVVDQEGMVKTGSSAQNRYAARSFYSNIGTDVGEIYGSDVGMVDFFTENVDRLMSGELSLKEVNHAYQESLQYSDKQFGETLSVDRINPEIQRIITDSSMPDPLLKLNKRGKLEKGANFRRQPIGEKSQKKLMKKEALAGRAQLGASDIAAGIIHTTESPIYKIPFLSETNNPKQLFRNVQYRNTDGDLAYMSRQDTLFMSKDDLQLLREELKADGKVLGELSPEQLLVNKKRAGTVIDRTRSESINPNKMTDHSEFLMKEMENITGLDNVKLSEALSKDGFNAFDSTIQEKLRKLSTDDYSSYLQRQLKESIAKRNTFLTSNSTLQTPEEFARLNGEISNWETKLKNSDLFGSSPDELNIIRLGREHKGLNIDNMHFIDGKLTFQFRRENKLSANSKIHDSSGETKSIIKAEVDNMPEYLSRVYKKKFEVNEVPKHIKDDFDKITFIANEEAMKTDAIARNSYSMFNGILNEAGLSKDPEINAILEDFKSEYGFNSASDNMKVFKKLDAVAKERGTSLHKLSGKDLGIGFSTQKIVAFGNAAVDMGYGGEAFFSERHVKMFHALGLKNFTNEMVAGRNNKGVIRAYKDLQHSNKMLKDAKFQGSFNLDDMSNGFLQNIFPNLDSDTADVLAHRNKFLSDRGVKGTAYVNLGEEIEGINKIAIFNTQELTGHIGAKIGSSGEYKKYTELDSITHQILVEASRKNKDPERLQKLVQNYKAAIAQLDAGLKKGIFKGKAEKGMYGLISSGRDGMEKYAEKLAESMGTKKALPFVAAVSDKKFIEMFGKDAYQQFKKTGLSKSWAMATREPVEGLSSVPLNIVPSSFFKDLNSLTDDAISVITNPDKNGFSLLKALFGDTDGDAFSLVAATSDESARELAQLAYGNSDDAISYRNAQAIKSKLSMKGQKQMSILEASLEEIREATFHAKDLEKGMVGIVSNALSPLHEVNMLKNGGGVDMPKYGRVENYLHIFAENILKGKHQTIEQLRTGNALRTLSAIVGTEEFANASVSDRIKNLRSFHDQLFLADGAHLGDRIRSGEKSAELIEEMKKLNIDSDTYLNEDWFQKMTSETSMADLLETADLSKRSASAMDAAMELSVEEVDEVLSANQKNNKKIIENMLENAEEAKGMMKGIGGNIMKYAVLPAAAFGFLGTLMGSKSRISQEGEVSDGQENHSKSDGSAYKIAGAPQMNNPKYMQSQVVGTGKGGFQIDKYTSQRGGGNVTYTDHTRSFDRLDMMDVIERGY